jgi:hypothetical protein
MQRQDYIERLIQQIAAFLARVAGLTGEGRPEEAERELDAAWMSLGLRRSDALRLDDGTLRMLLGAKKALAADLFEAQAALEESRAAPGLADELRQRAAELRR